MTTEQIEHEVAALVKQKINRDLGMTDDLRRAGLDSLKAIDLLLELEDRFEMTIPDEYMINETFAYMSNIVTMINTLKKNA